MRAKKREKILQGMALLGFAIVFGGLLSDFAWRPMLLICASGAALVGLALLLSVKYDETPR